MARVTWDEFSRAAFVSSRTWRAWRIQLVQALVVTAVLLAFFAAFTNHTPWKAMLVWLPLIGCTSAAATAWRIRRAGRNRP